MKGIEATCDPLSDNLIAICVMGEKNCYIFLYILPVFCWSLFLVKPLEIIISLLILTYCQQQEAIKFSHYFMIRFLLFNRKFICLEGQGWCGCEFTLIFDYSLYFLIFFNFIWVGYPVEHPRYFHSTWEFKDSHWNLSSNTVQVKLSI